MHFQKPDKEKSVMRQVAALIIKGRYVLFLLFALGCVFAVLSVNKVKINDDLTSFLPENTDTRRGITVMAEEFTTYASANVMVANIPYERAEALSAQLAEVAHVTDVSFDETSAHYNRASALFTVSFDGTETDEAVVAALAEIKDLVSEEDVYINTDIGVDFNSTIAGEMALVLALAAVVIVAVLLFTSRSYFEVVIFTVVFVVAAILNMGTNYWFGEISSITNSIAVILQLALAIDYAIIFCHRYQDAAAVHTDIREALEISLADSIVEISSSSLTTVSGLIALTFMQFGLGYDLGMVLTKGILFSMLTVFLLMPGLILLFPKLLKKTAHKNLIPDISGWGRFLMKTKVGFVLIFALLLPLAVYLSGHTVYAFADDTVDALVYSESRDAMQKINDTFDRATTVALIVPGGDYEAEKEIIQKLRALDKVESVTGLAGIEIEEGRVLTDGYTPRMFSLLLNIDYEEARLLYQAYGLAHQEYQPILGDAESYQVPLVDMFLYLFEKIDQGAITLEDAAQTQVEELRGSLERGVAQLRGTTMDRIVLTADVAVEGEESLALVEAVRSIGEAAYGEGNVLAVGNITSAADLSESYNSDSLLINIITILFVFLVLLFTFRSFGGAVLLVFVIQGSIWINFSFPCIMDSHPSFVTNMIVSAIQMGATIDYAIVLYNRFLERKKDLPVRQAMVQAIKEAFPTVLTSGSILAMAGLLIAFRVSDVYIGHIGLAVGRGAIISCILVLTVLPQLLVLLNGFIEKTTFRLKRSKEAEHEV